LAVHPFVSETTLGTVAVTVTADEAEPACEAGIASTITSTNSAENDHRRRQDRILWRGCSSRARTHGISAHLVVSLSEAFATDEDFRPRIGRSVDARAHPQRFACFFFEI